ncbi:cell division protease FtsH [Nitrobacteraceae bacterium AZCC 2161]
MTGMHYADPPVALSRMGRLERAVYKSDWISARAYRLHLAAVAARRNANRAADALESNPPGTPEPAPADEQSRPQPGRLGLAALRNSISGREDVDDVDDESVVERDVEAPAPGRIAARLLFARLFDRNPSIMRRFTSGSPVVVVDVPDAGLHSRIAHHWQDVLALGALRFIDMASLSDRTRREDCDAIRAVFGDVIAAKDRAAADTRAFAAVQLALPIIAITPSAETHLSKVLLDAMTDRLVLPSIDAELVRGVIRIVSGKRCADEIPEELVAQIGLHELLLAVRFDRTPEECIENLSQFARAKIAKAGSRDLSLDEMFGLDEAVAWARSTAADLQAWKRGEIAWDALDAGIVLNGPPGTGKTLFAKLASEHFKVPMIAATLAKWQGSGEGHLGHLLRAMKKDFDEARAKAPCVLFIDELDSFPNRSGVTHSHKDYVVEVVNAFIEQLDGVQGRQGLIFIAATNDVRRCDPAIVRSGRLNRIIHVGLPGPSDIEKMMRVRLRGDLQADPIEDVCLLATGSSGADVERIVKDARRYARQERRAMSLADLRHAVVGREHELSPEMLERASVHEAGHIVVGVVHDGPSDIHAVVAGSRSSAGFVLSRNRGSQAGTLAEYRKTLQGLLAGRAAEELELGAAGDGAGGSQGSDLALATSVAAALVGSLGHVGPHPLVFLADHFRTDAILDQAYMRAAVQDELATALEEAKQILSRNGRALKEVAVRLRTKGRIDGHEVERIIESFADAPDHVRTWGGVG